MATGGEVSRPELSRAVVAARLWVAGRSPYAAAALFALDVVESAGRAMLAVDERWRLFVRPEVIDSWTTAQLGAALLHQVEHLRRHHWDRREALADDPGAVWQLAADAEVNDDLVRDGFGLPRPAVVPRLLGSPDGLMAEEYAAALVAVPPVGGCHELLGERPACGSFLPDAVPAHADGLPAGLDPLDVEALVEQIDVSGSARRGDDPGAVRRSPGDDGPEAVDWRHALSRCLRDTTATASGYADFTYSRPSRRASASPGVILPALRQPSPTVAVVVDTSGSVSAPALAAAVREVRAVIAGMASRMGHLWVLACDAAVHDVRSVRRLADLDGLTLTGGGGTDLRVGMRAAAALRPAPDVTVVLTDGRSPWPHRRPRGRTVIGLVDVSDRPPGLPSWATVVDVTPAARPIRQAR